MPYPGSAYQRWHRDGLGPTPAPERWVSLHWVLDDASSPNQGPLEYLPCTQHIPDLWSGYDGSGAESRPLTAALDRLLSEPGGEGSGGGAGGSIHGGAGALGAWGREWEDGHKGPHRLDGRTAAAFTPVPMLMRPGEVWFRDNMAYRGSPVSAAP